MPCDVHSSLLQLAKESEQKKTQLTFHHIFDFVVNKVIFVHISYRGIEQREGAENYKPNIKCCHAKGTKGNDVGNEDNEPWL